ncbi:MAG: translocation/assembly module TamB domain-containing protein, partial [Candidatus Poribacteria bacterium]|nr:translocation/assembly module TamB domain-containing protein [Candidatus Poribacteria bacterium]
LNGGAFFISCSVKTPPDGRVWENPPTMDLQTSISSALLEQPGKYQIQLGANPTQLHLQGGFDDPSLTGNLNISQGYYEQNWEAVVDWFARTSVSEVDVILDYPILRDLYLNLDIDIPDNFRVLSSITGPTNIEISSSGGKLIGPIQNPIFNGTVSVISGRIGLVPQTFEFIEGSRITNGSTSEFDPELNILLQTPDRIRGVLPRDQSTVDLEINASLTGTLKNPAFVLSAPNAPEILSHEEIMTFLIRNAAFSRAFWGFTFNFHRPYDEDARSISAEYQLRENMSIKIENNEKGEYGVGFEIKGRF